MKEIKGWFLSGATSFSAQLRAGEGRSFSFFAQLQPTIAVKGMMSWTLETKDLLDYFFHIRVQTESEDLVWNNSLD